ncbi:MAG: hypothetical protein ACSW8I_00720 [bacterium]
MKKVFLFMGLLVFAGLTMSCSGGIEGDAAKMAKKTDKCMQLINNVDDELSADAAKEMKACIDEFEQFSKEIEAKYTEKEDQEAFIEAFNQKLKDIDSSYDAQTCLFMMFMASQSMEARLSD